MTRLLSADWARLVRSPLFWVGGAFMALYGAWNVVEGYNLNTYYGDDYGPEHFLFDFLIMLILAQSIVTVNFIYAEHRDGTLRNKLCVGHTRAAVYMSHLLTQYLVALIYSALYLVVLLGLGLPVLGWEGASWEVILEGLFCAMWVELSVTALFATLALLTTNKRVIAAGLMGALMLLTVCSWMDSQLSIPEYTRDYGVAFDTLEDGTVRRYFIDENGDEVDPEHMEPIPDPNYVRGPLRGLYRLVLDVTPTGQALQLAGTAVMESPLWVLGVSAAGLALLAAAGGIMGFWRMDID